MKIFNFKSNKEKDQATTDFLNKNNVELEKNDVLAMIIAFLIVSAPVIIFFLGLIFFFFYITFR